MYKKGDYIVYGNAGVYKVEDITTLKGISYAEKNKEYYVLKPAFSSGVVYYPVDSDKVFTRHIITKEEAEKIIALIPEIKVETKDFDSTNELSEYYKSIISNHNCKDLVELLMTIYKKKEIASEQKRKLWQVDEVYQKQAEIQLYSEFAVALNIDISEVEAYIQEKIK